MLNSIKKIRAGNLLLLVVLFLLLFYVVYRAANLSITHDEGLTFEIILGNKYLSETANNHFLNTFLMSVCYKLFGSSELSLRIPNILGFILYAFACFELLKNKKVFVILTGISFLLLNPYLMDFFSLARGYGLGLGFFMMSLLYLLRATQAKTVNSYLLNASLTILFSVAACFSNLTYINTNLIVLFLLFISFLFIKKDWKGSRKMMVLTAIILSINLCCLTGLVNELFKLRDAHELYQGGTNGFIPDTLDGLVHCSLYSSSDGYGQLFKLVLCRSVLVLYIIMLVYVILIRKYNKLSVIMIFLSLMIIGPLLEYMLFGTALPTGRTALLYIPLMGLTVSFFWEGLLDRSPQLITRNSVNAFTFFIFFVPINYNFLTNMNLSYCLEWQYDMDSKNMLLELNKIRPKTNSQLSLGITWYFDSSVNFYRKTLQLDWLNAVGRGGLKPENDYFYISEGDINKIPDNDIRIIKYYQHTHNYLVQNIRKIQSVKLIQLKAINNKYVCADGMLNNIIIANRDKASTWETFSLIMFENNECAIKAYDEHYFSIELNQQNEITANEKVGNSVEIFTIVTIDTNYVAFKATNGQYLSFDEKTFRINAIGEAIGNNEKFKMINK